ncbi:MAG: cytidylyltransferase domain-containing protein [Flavobacteriales bacterium]
MLITICARGGSKGIPKKNIRDLNGKPLIQYTYDHALVFGKWLEKEHQISSEIALSTDSEEIKLVSENFGLTTKYTRPDFLANDMAGKLDAIKDVLLFEEKQFNTTFQYILDLDVSAPMRTLEDLKAAFEIFIENDETENLYSVSEANKNPYFNMVEENESGYFSLSKAREQVLSRQKAPKVYEMNASFYFYKREFYDKEKLYLFDKSKVFAMNHLSFDLDHMNDFDYLEFLLTNNKLTFQL